MRVFVIRVVRKSRRELLGLVETVATRKRMVFRTADALWHAIGGSTAKLPLSQTGNALERRVAQEDVKPNLVD